MLPRSLTALPAVLAGAPITPAPVPAQPSLEALGWTDIADELRAQLRTLARQTPAWKRARCAFVIREDGVELVERSELATHYRRNGLRALSLRVQQAPLGLALVVLEGDEVALFSYDLAAWLASEGA